MNAKDRENLIILRRFLDQTFKGATFGEIKIDDLLVSLDRAIKTAIISWLKALGLVDIALGAALGFLAAGALATTFLHQTIDAAEALAIENAQLQVADALSKTQTYYDSMVSAATAAGCSNLEPRVRP